MADQTSAHMTENDRSVRPVLVAHFVMWTELDGPGPRGEWRCHCGRKFGFSDSAIDHVTEQVEKLVQDRIAAFVERAEAKYDALRKAVQQTYDLQCPPMAVETYVDEGAHMAHQWWSTVLGGVLKRHPAARLGSGCANYAAPTTCLTAPSSVTGRCDHCKEQADA